MGQPNRSTTAGVGLARAAAVPPGAQRRHPADDLVLAAGALTQLLAPPSFAPSWISPDGLSAAW